MVDRLKLLFEKFTGGPSTPRQPEISKGTVADALKRKPRRICFASAHKNALKRKEGDRWVGSFSVPFPESVYPIFYDMTDLSLSEAKTKFEGQQRPSWWRSVRDDAEFELIEKWMGEMGSLVFLSDQLALSVSLGEYQTPEGGRSEIGELEYLAKWKRDEKTIARIVDVAYSRITSLPYYKDAEAICAVPPRPGKDFDLPTQVVTRLAKALDIPDLTVQLEWKGAKPSLKETPFEQKWDALAGVDLKPIAINAKSVILFDDLYQSGITIQFVARHIVRSGAKQVFGMTIVKSRGDSDNQ